MDETPFFRLKLSAEEIAQLRSRQPAPNGEAAAGLQKLVRFSFAHGCLPTGRFDRSHVRREGDLHPTLLRTATAICATQRGFEFRPVCYVFPPVLDPWLGYQSAALLSRDGRFGIAVHHYHRDGREELIYTCTTTLTDGTYYITRPAGPGFFDPPGHRIAASPVGGVQPLLAAHTAAVERLSVVPFTAAAVTDAILALNRDAVEHNLAAGRYVPLSAREVDQVRRAMRGDDLRDALR